MHRAQLVHLKSIEALRQHAPAWNDLWRRSCVTIPTLQAELIDHWFRTFGQGTSFRALAIEQGGRFMAALPLVSHRRAGIMQTGMLTTNEWTPAGDLLLDPSTDTEATLDLLAHGISELPWPLLWLDYCLIGHPRWQALIAACERVGLGTDIQEQFQISRIEVQGTWEEYRQTWSRNHRRNMTRYRRKLADEHGPVQLRLLRLAADANLGALLRRGFEIEDRSWKGAAGSSVLRCPGMFSYFVRQAELLAAREQLEIAFLDVGGHPIAFEYGWLAKDVYHPFKIGYDERFHEYCPGQLLIHDLLEQFFRTGSHAAFDCIGPTSAATSKWQTSQYAVGRMLIAPRRMLSQSLLYAYKHLWPALRRWRPAPKLLAEKVTIAEGESTLV